MYSYYLVLLGPQDNYLQSVTKTTEIISNLQKRLTLTHNHGDWGLIFFLKKLSALKTSIVCVSRNRNLLRNIPLPLEHILSIFLAFPGLSGTSNLCIHN